VKPRHLLVLAALLLALLLARHLLAGPEERIRRELDEMADEASKAGPEPAIAAAASARSLARRFAADAEAFDGRTGRSVRGRDELARAIAWGRESYVAGRVRLEDLEVRVVTEAAAEAGFRVRVLDADGRPASEHDGVRVDTAWVLEPDGWAIVHAGVREGPPEGGAGGPRSDQ
jgi:hypothetical protein